MVSANPVLEASSGLTRGFSAVHVSPSMSAMRGPAVVAAVAEALRGDEVKGRDGIFLFVNMVDAHNYLAPVPAGQGWVPARPLSRHDPGQDPDDPLRRYVQGRMEPGEAAKRLAAMRDGYDWGVHLEDRSIGGVLRVVHARGWDRAGLRLVVVSDHGEMLGEHGAMEHGPYLYEGTQRVPIVTMGIEGRLPQGVPVSAGIVHDLLLNGAVPDPLPEASAVAVPSENWESWSGGRVGTSTQVGRWAGSEKVLSQDGAAVRYDLAQDPGEERPTPLAESEVPPQVRAIEAELAVVPTGDVLSPELIEALKRAGYLE